jgi:glycosyltransferase involved in cell wall biosynthesis
MVDESSLKIFERLNERLSAARLVVLTSGVIDRRKNIEYVLNAFESLQKSGKGGDAMLLVAGDGPLLKQFRADAATRKIPSIEFLGWCDSLEPLYPFVDLVVHPALHEGVPNSVLEALAAGIPVLCANTPEMREILGAEELLFNPADPQELTGHLTKILTEPSNHLRTLSEVSGKASERLKFDWDEKASSLVASS